MSKVGHNRIQLGDDSDPNKNFVIGTPSPNDGELEVRTGTVEEPGNLVAKFTDSGIEAENIFVNNLQTPLGLISPVGSFKNKIINGDFSVWQRGTTQATGVSGYGCADRWLFTSSVTGLTRTVGRVSALSASGGQFKYCAGTSITSTSTAAGSYVQAVQRIEGVNTLSGKTATISFYASGTPGVEIAVELLQRFGTGGSEFVSIPLGRVELTSGSFTRYEITTDIPSIEGKTVSSSNDDSLDLFFWMSAGSNFSDRASGLGPQQGSFNITGVQLEEGPYATPFEQRPIGVELALCERYYQKYTDLMAIGWAPTTAAHNGFCSFPLPSMRASPTVTFTTNTTLNLAGTIAVNRNYPNHLRVGISSGGAIGSFYWQGVVERDAEL